jgi:hypothetical protein
VYLLLLIQSTLSCRIHTLTRTHALSLKVPGDAVWLGKVGESNENAPDKPAEDAEKEEEKRPRTSSLSASSRSRYACESVSLELMSECVYNLYVFAYVCDSQEQLHQGGKITQESSEIANQTER